MIARADPALLCPPFPCGWIQGLKVATRRLNLTRTDKSADWSDLRRHNTRIKQGLWSRYIRPTMPDSVRDGGFGQWAAMEHLFRDDSPRRTFCPRFEQIFQVVVTRVRSTTSATRHRTPWVYM